MAEVIRMPRMSDTMEEGVIAAWHKKKGDKVSNGDLLAEIETDKATMDFESPGEGTLLYIGAKEGESIDINAILVILGDKDEDVDAILKEEEKKEKEKSSEKAEEKASEEEEDEAVEIPTGASKQAESKSADKEKKSEEKEDSKQSPELADVESSEGRIKASPLARRIAAEKNISISKIKGSGDDGRIVKKDVEEYLEKGGAEETGKIELPKVVQEESYEDVSLSQMRKTIAKRLAESKFNAPHFYLTMEVKMDRAMEARKKLNEVAPLKISFNDIIVKATAHALKKHPQVNSSWLGDKIRINHHVNIGVAVAVEEGLLVPVLRYTDAKSLSHIAQETRKLAEKAKNKKLQTEEMQGNTFTISNLGMFDIDEFTAIINPPDACILAVGKIKEVPVLKDGELASENIMKITLSCDHRLVDGATGAKFLQTLKAYLEEPLAMLV
ncbi:MAG: pyruvate dehydrogenase complex dihydrolipoamide acetyltransferase [Chitinophagales bacterium]